MKECKIYCTLISEYLEGQITGEAKKRLEDHFSSCEGCKEKLEGVRSTMRILNDLEPLRTSPDLDLAIRGRIREELVRSDSPSAFFNSLRDFRLSPVLATAAAVIVISLGAMFLYRAFRDRGPVEMTASVGEQESEFVGADVRYQDSGEVRKYILEKVYPQDIISPPVPDGMSPQAGKAHFTSAKYLVF